MKKTIKQLRLEKGMTQEKLGELLGCTKQNVSYYELGKRKPDMNVMEKLFKIFDVKYEDLDLSIFFASNVPNKGTYDEIIKQ